MTEPNASDRRALVLIFDGLGFNRTRGAAVAEAAWRRLPDAVSARLMDAALRTATGLDGSIDPGRLAVMALFPGHVEALPPGLRFAEAGRVLGAIRAVASDAAAAIAECAPVLRSAARDLRYAPWTAAAPTLYALRNEGVTWPTSAAGIWAGFEDLDPPVQGNSDTGHQQIGNLAVAPQTPLEITRSIEDGSFFHNESLQAALSVAGRDGSALNFSFMLSGTRGSDGRVHSAWNHLTAFLKLVFEQHRLPPARVRMQAILDGRDSPGRSSIEESDGVGDYIGRLERLLDGYGATSSLAWVIGRNIAMDRDYREPNARTDYLLLTRGEGARVSGFDGLRAAVRQAHASGKNDGDVPPMVVVHDDGEPRQIGHGEAFVNLQFRADRQRARTGSLLHARDFLATTALAHGKHWSMDWLGKPLDLTVCTLSDYHPEFERLGARVAFPNRAQPANFLAAFPELLPGERYLLAGESVKSAHVGFFIRGRREAPDRTGVEDREIIPSCGPAEGVSSDSDYWRTPAMRTHEIADFVKSKLGSGYRLILANLSSCDMIGHLLPDRFDAAVRACEAVDAALARLVPAAREAGYDVVLTADHGNIEDDTTAHSTNDVLTTVLPATGAGRTLPAFRPAPRELFQARLFDISWTLGRLFGVSEQRLSRLVPTSQATSEDRFMGSPLIDCL